MMMRQIGMFLLFVSSLIPVSGLWGQERPTFSKTVLTRDGPVTQDYWADELLVKLAPSATQRKSGARYVSSFRPLAAATAPPGFERFGVIPYHGTVEGLQALQAAVATDPSYEWVSFSPVFRAYQTSTNDPLRWGQWQLSENFPGNIGWQYLSIKADHVYVVFADTGGCFGHEDFDWSRNFWNYNALEPNKLPTDDNGHGCAVASIVAAKTNNGLGISGIADFIRFGFVKVLDKKGNGDTSVVVNGLLAIAAIAKVLKQYEPHARVILNLSFGAMDFIEPVAVSVRAVKEIGVIVVTAAGNNGLNIDRIVFTPASMPEVITVGANDWDNAVAARGSWASNWGPKSVLLVAPGLDVMAAVPKKGTATDKELFDPSGYRRVDGTSFAAPHVTGAIVLMLAKDPEFNEDQIRVRLMNANRDMKPWRLNLRDFQSEELFTSAGSLRLDQGALAEDYTLPAQPYVEVVQAGHSSAQLLIAGTGDDGTNGKPFGVQCAFTTDGRSEIFEAVPWLGATREEGPVVTLRGNNRAPLQEGSLHQVACQVVDKVGNWSAMSELAIFQTTTSLLSFSGLVGYATEAGPTSEFVVKFNGDNPILWHQTSVNSGTTVWYAGNDELNYRGRASDSELVSPEIDLRSVTGSISLRLSHFLQMFGLLMQGSHYDGAEIRVEDLNTPGSVKIVAENLPNSTTFGLEEYALDLSEFAGKRIRLRFRFFTNGSSSVGIGWIIGEIKIKTDVR